MELTAFMLFAGHFVCDYPLQTEFIAIGKNPASSPHNGVPWPWIMLGHAFTHGAAVALITGSAFLGLAETVAHFVIDWCKCKQLTNINTDQYLHLLCKAVWILILQK